MNGKEMEMHFYGKLTIGLDQGNLRLGLVWSFNHNNQLNISIISKTGV